MRYAFVGEREGEEDRHRLQLRLYVDAYDRWVR